MDGLAEVVCFVPHPAPARAPWTKKEAKINTISKSPQAIFPKAAIRLKSSFKDR